MPGIPPELVRRLHETLTNCGPFDSDRSLRATFTDARIYPWRDSIPEAKSRAARVNALVSALLDQADAQGNPALALFVEVLAGGVSPGDACHGQLVQLASELRGAIQENQALPSPATAESLRESKYAVHIHGGQVGVIGDSAHVHGAPTFGEIPDSVHIPAPQAWPYDERTAEIALMTEVHQWWRSIRDYEGSALEMGSASENAVIPQDSQMGLCFEGYEYTKIRAWPFLRKSTRDVIREVESAFLSFTVGVYAGVYNHEVSLRHLGPHAIAQT